MEPSAEAPRPAQIRGSLLLSACGDALGKRFEGAPVVDPAAVDEWLATPPDTLCWTDDTAMALVLAEHLVSTGGSVDPDRLATEFAAAWAAEPGRGYGTGTAAALHQIRQGAPWSRVAAALFDGHGSLGNGGAMRVAPVGLVPGRPLTVVAAAARRSAAVTHAHPQAQDGAAVQAVAVAIAARTAPDPVDPDALVAQLAVHAHTAEFRTALQRITALLRHGPDPHRVAAEVGNDVTALASVPAALAAYLCHPDDPAAAIRFAINLGGDTDTIAAMAGALSGARLGDGAVPAAWLRRLEAADRIGALAGELAGLHPDRSPGQ